MKKICDHPGLLTARAAAAAVGRKIEGGDDDEEEDDDKEEEEEFDSDDDDDFIDDGDDDGEYKPKKKTPSGKGKEKRSSSKAAAEEQTPLPPPPPPSDPAALALEEQLLSLIAERGAAASCKTSFAPKLVRKLVSEGHRVLVFSQSRVMLDIVGAALQRQQRSPEKGPSSSSFPFLRIDGTVTSAAARQAIVAQFQDVSNSETSSSPPVLLLTTGVGALGLTLTAATRVVLVEPG